MPGSRYRKFNPAITKVKYIEVKRTRGSFYKEIKAPRQRSAPASPAKRPTTTNHLEFSPGLAGYDNWSDIPIYTAPHTKVWNNL